MKPTTLYLLRHGATRANLEKPYRLQGRRVNPPLAPLGVRQAELTRALLADVSVQHIYSSPLRRAVQTAQIIARTRRLRVQRLPELIECDVGRWERRTWPEIAAEEPLLFHQFEKDPARFGYPDGESFADVAVRVVPVFERLLQAHAGQTLLVVSHHVVCRVYLATLFGLKPGQARRVKLDNCGVSIVSGEHGRARVATLNATLHLGAVHAA